MIWTSSLQALQDPATQGAAQDPGDAAVVARVLGGEREAYRILVRRHQDALYRHALRMTGHGDTAADLVQTALVKAYRKLDRCREPDRFGAWVFRILANACKDYLRNPRRREISLDAAPHAPACAKSDPAADLERAELAELMRNALARLPAIQREALALKHMEGRSYEEIAEMLDVSISALKMRVMRGREALRAALEGVL